MCNECLCEYCLFWWSQRCKYGECYDDYRAKVDPYPVHHMSDPPRTAWTNWDKPGEQRHWCRGGMLYPTEECDHFEQYEGQEIVECVKANTQVFQDGYRMCSMMINGSCERCLKELSEQLEAGHDRKTEETELAEQIKE